MFQAILLGIIQGVTEFLPISSTAHLILAPWIFGWDDPGLAFDVVLHLGTLTGIIAFFRKDFYSMLQGMFSPHDSTKEYAGKEGMVGWYIIIGTIPAGLAGLFFKGPDRDCFAISPHYCCITYRVWVDTLVGGGFRQEENGEWIT